MTKDPTTADAVRKLQSHFQEKGGLTVPNILAASEAELSPLICKVGFHNKKLVYLKQVAEVLHTKYNDDIPDSVEELCQLSGIGTGDHCRSHVTCP